MGENLTRTALFLLGLIANESINPYNLCKLINHNRRNLRTNKSGISRN
jgi:hypothetical protein